MATLTPWRGRPARRDMHGEPHPAPTPCGGTTRGLRVSRVAPQSLSERASSRACAQGAFLFFPPQSHRNIRSRLYPQLRSYSIQITLLKEGCHRRRRWQPNPQRLHSACAAKISQCLTQIMPNQFLRPIKAQCLHNVAVEEKCVMSTT